MNVLIAFDKFKDSLSAEKACARAARTVGKQHPDWGVETAPLTDGGEGFCRILTRACQGRLFTRKVCGPRFQRTPAQMGLIDLATLEPSLHHWLDIPKKGTLAIIEMAQASGLQMLIPTERNLWGTSSYGTGELIATAHEMAVEAILLGLGGSASHDLGLGALEALGLKFLTSENTPLNHLTPRAWGKVVRFTGTLPPTLPPIRIACDVQNPLLGENGGIAVYGPQKGLKTEDTARLERLTARLAYMFCDYLAADRALIDDTGSGAAGGISFALRVACGARLKPGFELVAHWLKLEEKVSRADLIITGEGRFDRSSLQGKGPGTLIEMAAAKGKRLWIFAGQVEGDLMPLLPQDLQPHDVCPITPQEYPLERALREGEVLLEQALHAKLASW